jgi:hypothetical protein
MTRFTTWLLVAVTAIGIFKFPHEARASEVKWLLETLKPGWTESTKWGKVAAAKKVGDGAYEAVDGAASSSGATDLYERRRDNPSAVLAVGSIQAGQKKMADTICSALQDNSCHLLDGTTKGAATIGEYQNLSNRHDQAASKGSMGESIRNLATSMEQGARDKIAIDKENRRPIEDRSFEKTRAAWGVVQYAGDNINRALDGFAAYAGRKTFYNADGSKACGEMLWYMNLGEKCKEPEASDEAEPSLIGMRTVGDQQCFPDSREVNGFAKVAIEPDGTVMGCRVGSTQFRDGVVQINLICPVGEGKVVVSKLPNSDNMRITWFAAGESMSTDFEPCDISDLEPPSAR